MDKDDYKYHKVQRWKRKMTRVSRHLPTLIALLVITAALGVGVCFLYRFVLQKAPWGRDNQWIQAAASASSAEESAQSSQEPSDEPQTDETVQLLEEAGRLASGYDYDKAIQLLSNAPNSGDPRIAQAVTDYEAAKTALVPANTATIPHVFFHSLIMDTAKAFDGDADSSGYNSVMTTKDEFLNILESMYDRGYVLVRIHDIAYESTDEEGNTTFVKGNIMLPEGKKPFVMSQDDVCYYPYMDGDGFAKRIVVGQDGKPTSEMVMEDGTISTGSYDLIPLLEDFIQEHPDFSYRGARAIIAFTGYEGILGYRTSGSYEKTNPNYQQDREQAARVAQCLRDNGWELASHSWGHLRLGVDEDPSKGFAIKEERFQADTDKWEAEVESLIGPTDIILYPFGNDIADWRPYKEDNPRFQYLESKGFRYFCNVDASTPYWIQMGTNYFRMARINLDGYRLYQDLIQTDPSKKRLSPFLNAEEIFDSSRPTPVGWEY